MDEKIQQNPTERCPRCDRMPFGVVSNVTYFCGEFIEEFSCGSCRSVIGISVAPRGPIGGSYVFSEWDRLVRQYKSRRICYVSTSSNPPPDQPYEVSCLGFDADDPDKRTVVGYTDAPDGGSLVRMVEKHPVWNSSQVRDTRQ